MQEINQDTLLRASYLEQESQSIENSINFIHSQIKDLENFLNQLNDLEKNQNNEILSNLGRGVFMKTNIVEKSLFVEVGAGVVIKKTLPETISVIEGQISKFKEAKLIYQRKQEENTKELMQIIEDIENLNEKNS